AQKKRSKKGQHKASYAKLANKRLNRLVKQGKLKPKKSSERKKLLDAIKKRDTDGTPKEPEDIPLEEADYEYFATPGRNLGFLTQGSKLGDKPKRKRKHNDFHVEEDYEQLPRKRLGEEKQFRVLLPIKSKEKGIITQVEEVQSEENKEDEKEDQPLESTSSDSSKGANKKSLPLLSTAEILLHRRIRLSEQKEKMALLASDVIEQPQEAVSKIEGKVLTRHKKGATNGILIPPQAKGVLRELAVRCLCELLITHPHFNYRTNIITVVIPFITHRSNKLSDLVCGYVKRLFREDKSGEVTLEVVRLIGRIIKSKHFEVKPKVLQLFLSLKIKEVNKGDKEVENKAARREKLKKMSKRERKRYKQMKELERELGDASAEEKRKHKLKLNTEIVSLIFLTYFRILKTARQSILLSSVLEGLAKFAHLINLDFFDDLFAVLNDLVNSGDLTYRESLHCVQTAFTILSGQGAALNIDPMNFYRHLYCTLFQLHAGVSSEDMLIALKCMDVMINKRRKQLESHGIIGALAMVRGFMQFYPKTDLLLDTDYQGSGTFLPNLEEPEHCNAHNTALYELHFLQRHYHPMVRRYSTHILAGAPSQGSNSLPVDIAHNLMTFNPPISKPVKGRRKMAKTNKQSDFCQSEIKTMITKAEAVINDIDLTSVISQMYTNKSLC
ncbi:hypothetical protein LSH36_516g00022, partial [Paralvinella palmiformis]